MTQINKYILIPLAFVFVNSLFAQTWPQIYGESDRYEFSEDIEESYDYGYKIAGNFLSENYVQKSSWLIKTDINGEILWEKVFSNSGYNKTKAITQSADGGTILCGLIRYAGENSSSPFVAKLNACGEKEWCRVFSEEIVGAESSWACDVKETLNGDIIVLVNQYGNHPIETMHLFKLNADGEVLWRNPYASAYEHPGSINPMGWKIFVINGNDYLIAGDIYWKDPWNPGGSFVLRPLLVLVNNIGEEKWVLPFGLNDTLIGGALGITKVNSNELLAVGYSRLGSTFDEGLVMLLNMDGREINYKKINAKAIDSSMNRVLFYHITKIDSAYIFGGVLGIESSGSPTMETISDTNIFNSTSNFYKLKRHEELHTPYSLSITSEEELLSNSTKNPSSNWDISLSKLNRNLEYDTLDPGTYIYDSLCTTPGLPQTSFISLDDCNLFVDIDEIPNAKQYQEKIRWIPIKAYPNPVTHGKLTLEFENTQHHQNMELCCYDNFGRQVHSQLIYRAQQDVDLDVSGWSTGIYIAVVFSNGEARGKCKFVVE